MKIINHIKAALLYVWYYRAIQWANIFDDREYHRIMKIIQDTKEGKL